MKKTIVVLLLLSVISACKKKPDCSDVYVLNAFPKSLFILIKQGGQRLPDAILDDLDLSYYTNTGEKKYLDEFMRAVNGASFPARDVGIMGTRNIAFLSGSNNIKNYYLEFPNGDIDTLFVDYKQHTPCEADTNACRCIFERMAIKFNGGLAPVDSSISNYITAYLLNK